MLTNFDLVQKMCEVMNSDAELAEKYAMQIAYFKKNFYKDSVGRSDTEKYVYLAASQLDNLLRKSIEVAKYIICIEFLF